MFIIPYYIEESKSKAGFKMWKAWVFLANGGKEIWETDEDCSAQEVIEEYLTPNGFTGKTLEKNGCLLMTIDKSTDFSELYTWKEFLQQEKGVPAVPVLKPFFWIGDTPGIVDDWGWNEQCESVNLGRFGSLAKLWDMFEKPT
jgi:hypothetical protein